MDDMKKCWKCGIISLKSSFQKNKSTKDGVLSESKTCRKKMSKFKGKLKKSCLENHGRLYNNQNLYKKESRTKINLCEKKRIETDFVHILPHNIRVRTSQAFKNQNVEKETKRLIS